VDAMKKRKVRKTENSPSPPTGLDRLFTIDQIAQTGVACRAKLYKDIRAGRLKAKKFGRSTRITESAFNEYLQGAPALPVAAAT
jgi:excisionase family DNA binding protein